MSLDERLKSEGDLNYEAIMGYYDEAVDKPQAAADIMGIPPRRMGGVELRAQVSDFVLDLSYEEMKEVEQELGIDPHRGEDLTEGKSTCCGKCGHSHVKGTSCPKPFLTGKSHCNRRTNEGLENPDNNPCWKGYHPVGTKMKGGKEVPNCVPINEEVDESNEFCPQCLAEYITENYNSLNEAEYRGRKVSLGKPFLTPDGPKKRSVYVKNAKGNVVKVNFGDPNMRIKKSIPARRKSYRARHHCQNPGPKWKANYWSCKAW